MLFHTFSSQKERKQFGGSFFIEIQYCRLARGTSIEKIVSVDAISNWRDDSLYIYGNDDNEFLLHYGKIFTDGIYNNRKSGAVDLCGINYYSEELADLMAETIKEEEPPDYQVLLDWLKGVKEHNGFYVLGL